MATVTVEQQEQTLGKDSTTEEFLKDNGVACETWTVPRELADLAAKAALSEEDQQRVLRGYSVYLEREAKGRDYLQADMIVLNPSTPDIEELLAKFDKPHYHDDDEVRYIFDGEGVFGFEPEGRPSFTVTVTAGDYIIVPANTYHWFTLTDSRSIKAIRLFKDNSGWVPHYKGAMG